MIRPEGDGPSHVADIVRRRAVRRPKGVIGDIFFRSDGNHFMKLRSYVDALIKETHAFQNDYQTLTADIPEIEIDCVGDKLVISYLDSIFAEVNSTLSELQELCKQPNNKHNKRAFISKLKNLLWDGMNEDGLSKIPRTKDTPVGLRGITEEVHNVIVKHHMLDGSDKQGAAEFIEKVKALNRRYNDPDNSYGLKIVKDIGVAMKVEPQKER